MRYSIEGFSQERAVELGLSAEDLVILRWFVDYWPSKNMVKLTQGDKEYGFVKYAGFAEQMPIISCNKRTIARKFQRLVDAGVLENTTVRAGGTYSVYRFGPTYETLVENCTTGDKVVQPVVEECAGGLSKSVQGGCTEMCNQNTSTFNKTKSFNETNTHNTTSVASGSHPDYAFFKSVYNSTCSRLPECQVMTQKRQAAITAFLKEFTPDQWREVCQKANQSLFLTGGGSRGWKADIDFLLKPDKAARILEGGYQDEEKTAQSAGRELDGDEFAAIQQMLNGG